MEQRCPNKSRTTTTTTLDEDDSSDDEEDSSCGIKGAPHSPPAMGFCEGFADRVAQMSCFTTFRIPYIYDMIFGL